MKISELPNKSALFFEQYQKGRTITEIADMFSTTRTTVTKYLKKHDKYVPQGHGNRLPYEKRNLPTKPESQRVANTTRLITVNVPYDLLDNLDCLPENKNRTEKILEGIQLYIDRFNIEH